MAIQCSRRSVTPHRGMIVLPMPKMTTMKPAYLKYKVTTLNIAYKHENEIDGNCIVNFEWKFILSPFFMRCWKDSV